MSNLTLSQKNFIEKIGSLATANMVKTKILASLTVAQAILESNWGTSGLTVKANALFGIKASANWKGKVYNSKTQECYDGVTFTTIEAAFRAYGSWNESVEDHLALLTGLPRYKAVVGETDYKKACTAIKAAGYATDPDYTKKLTDLIEKHNLTRFDLVGDVNLCIDGKIIGVVAENIGGNWCITLPQLGGGKFKIRDILSSAGYKVMWEDVHKTIVASK